MRSWRAADFSYNGASDGSEGANKNLNDLQQRNMNVTNKEKGARVFLVKGDYFLATVAC